MATAALLAHQWLILSPESDFRECFCLTSYSLSLDCASDWPDSSHMAIPEPITVPVEVACPVTLGCMMQPPLRLTCPEAGVGMTP